MTAANIVMQSFGRCCASTSFFDDFYRKFLDSSPLIRQRFVDTDMPAQKLLLRQGILNLVMHARGMPDTKLRALAETHSRGQLNIHPEWYDFWLEALLHTIAEHDKESDSNTHQAWREVLNKGISIIKAGY